MKQTINFSQFVDAFNKMGRGEQFSYEGLKRIYEWIEENEANEGKEWELDVIALCCEIAEMKMYEIIDAYNIDIDFEADVYGQVIDYIADYSTYIGDTPEGTMLFVQF